MVAPKVDIEPGDVTELIPEEWSAIAEEEITKEIIENVSSLRAAGL